MNDALHFYPSAWTADLLIGFGVAGLFVMYVTYGHVTGTRRNRYVWYGWAAMVIFGGIAGLVDVYSRQNAPRISITAGTVTCAGWSNGRGAEQVELPWQKIWSITVKARRIGLPFAEKRDLVVRSMSELPWGYGVRMDAYCQIDGLNASWRVVYEAAHRAHRLAWLPPGSLPPGIP